MYKGHWRCAPARAGLAVLWLLLRLRAACMLQAVCCCELTRLHPLPPPCSYILMRQLQLGITFCIAQAGLVGAPSSPSGLLA